MRTMILIVATLSFAPMVAAETPPVETPVAIAPSTLPPQIVQLEPFYEKQTEFVQALRDWGKAQIDAAEAELDEAKELMRARKQDEARKKKDSAVEKTKLVRQAYEFGLKKYSNDARLTNAYGELLYDQFGENAGALRAWNLAISLDAKYALPYNNLGLDQCHTGQYETGLTNLEKALELDPKNPDFMFNIAQIYLINFPQVEKIKKWKPKKIYDRAMKLSKDAADLDPTDYQLAEDYAVNFFAAENFKIEPDWELAAQAWQRARPLAGKPDRVFFTWLNEARCWNRAGKNDLALPCVQEALKIVPDSAPAKQMLENFSKPAEPKKDDKPAKKSNKKTRKGRSE